MDGNAKPINLAEKTTSLLHTYKDQVTGSIRIGSGLMFEARHYGVDASYTCEMKWTFGSDRTLLIKSTFRETTVSGIITQEDEREALIYFPVAEAWCACEKARWAHLENACDD